MMKRVLSGLVFFCLLLLSSGALAQTVVQDNLACQAYYTSSEDPGNPLLINLEDRSTGNMTNWLWSFGDGTFSDEQNPSHLFPSPGLYTVCLTISNPDPSSYCWDNYCDTIYINIIHDCEARFSMLLDSLNEEPNTFLFTDQSAGNPNSWLWLFGDGDLSTDQNPVHRYMTPGDYRVCLLIAETDTTGIQCYDSICHDMATPPYFDLGGHLFTGQYPINNPLSTGDTGIVFLYRTKGNTLTPADTSRFTEYGYFAFPQRLNGQYLIRAELTKGSTNYQHYFPSYYPSGITWKASGIVGLTDSSSYHSDIFMVPVTDTVSGIAMIRGGIVQNDSKQPLAVKAYAEVLVYNDQMVPRTFAFTDVAGNYEIPSLPFGTYYLVAEVAGHYSRVTAITLDAAHPLADSVILELFNHDVTGYRDDLTRKVTEVGNIYPNPVEDKLWFDVISPVSVLLKADIVSITGQVRQTSPVRSEAGRLAVTIPTDNLAPGFYLLLVHSSDGVLVTSRKFIKR
ncbi:MAG: PKD domain-containing protein [bacterium]